MPGQRRLSDFEAIAMLRAAVSDAQFARDKSYKTISESHAMLRLAEKLDGPVYRRSSDNRNPVKGDNQAEPSRRPSGPLKRHDSSS